MKIPYSPLRIHKSQDAAENEFVANLRTVRS